MNTKKATSLSRHKRLKLGGVGLAVFALTLAALPSSTAASSAGVTMTAAQELHTVGITTDKSFCGTKPITLGIHDGYGLNAWSQASYAAVRSEAAKCPNVKTIVELGQGDLQGSISQVNSMVSQGINALVIIPDFGKAQLPSLQAATAAGVKVVPWAADPSGVDGKDFVNYVDWLSADAGTFWANWMVNTLKGKGNVIMLGGPAGNPVTTGQLKSIVKVFAAHKGMKLLTGNTNWSVTNWDPATAQKVMGSLLAKYPKIDGIISDYGTDALAALRTMKAAGRSLVPAASTEANGLGCLWQSESKKTGNKFQLATISSRNWLGRIAARKAISAAEGIPNHEPSLISLPLTENSLRSNKPVCATGQADDFYNSNKITPAVLTKYGKP